MPIDILDLHPRPRLEQTFDSIRAPSASPAAACLAATSPPSPAVCTPTRITTTGNNGDEADASLNYIGNFHKGLPHDGYGEVVQAAYKSLLDAVGPPPNPPGDFTKIVLGLGRKLTNPQAGLATDVEGPDPSKLAMLSAPKVLSAETAAEAVELYWMALLRDVPFTEFEDTTKHALVQAAADDLSGLEDFLGPKSGKVVTPLTLFRGCTPGDLTGPYLSQFLLRDIPYGALTICQREQTVVGCFDYLTDYNTWLAVQNGTTNVPADAFDGTRRYIRNMRDLGQYVHVDALYEAYLNACLILLGMNAPFDSGNPYVAPNPQSKTQIGFGTFGGPHILSLVCEVATRALKAVWYQKWFIQRRLRPEAYGGLVHLTQTNQKSYKLHKNILSTSSVLEEVQRRHGSYLLPMAFPEGSPTHPSYGAGHATVAGACVTILKAWFDENWTIPNPVVASGGCGCGTDGLMLEPYVGSDANRLTVGGELNKLAANIAIGRNMAGVHWRSDYWQSVKLGQIVALCILKKQKDDYHEDYSFTLTTFEGVKVRVSKRGIKEVKSDGSEGADYNLPC
jgi:hypothetical protein